MQILEYLKPDQVLVEHRPLSKKAVLEDISDMLSKNCPSVIDKQEIFDAYVQREKLGSTGLGHGVAIPHIRNEHIESPIACVLLLKEPVDFDAEDRLPVDIIFALMVPSGQDRQHLNILAEISRLLINKASRSTLRQVSTSSELYQTLASLSHAEVA